MAWLDSAYDSLKGVNIKSALRKVGYTKCWDEFTFRNCALRSFAPDELCVHEQDEQESALENIFDQYDDVMVSLHLQEANAPGQE